MGREKALNRNLRAQPYGKSRQQRQHLGGYDLRSLAEAAAVPRE